MAVASHNVAGSKAFCETEVVLCHCAFTWTIKNFHFCCPDGETFDSPMFNSGVNKQYNWQLKLWRNKASGTKAFRTTTGRSEFELLILPSRNIKFAVVKCTLVDISEKELASYPLEIKRPDVLEKSHEWKIRIDLSSCRDLFLRLSKDFLKITLEATISHDQVCTFIQASEIDYQKTPAKFTHYLSSLFDKDSFSDFALKVQGRKFPVHKVILAANSPVFEAMFEHDFQEKNSGLLEITDFEADAVYELLSYMYSHKIPKFTSLDSVTSLYEIADKYSVDDLKELCKGRLISELNRESALDVLDLADKHCDEVLREEVMSFIQAHPEINFETVKTETFYEKLCTLLEHSKNIQPVQVFQKSKEWLLKFQK